MSKEQEKKTREDDPEVSDMVSEGGPVQPPAPSKEPKKDGKLRKRPETFRLPGGSSKRDDAPGKKK